MPNEILFYDPRNEYGCFSNFANYGVAIYGWECPTSEHPFQAMKSEDPEIQKWIATSPTPGIAAFRGRSTRLRPEWDLELSPGHGVPLTGPVLYKDKVMFEVVLAKFIQNSFPRRVLLGTGSSRLIEDALHDPYWGWGASKVGVNRLGQILMAVRTAISEKLNLVTNVPR